MCLCSALFQQALGYMQNLKFTLCIDFQQQQKQNNFLTSFVFLYLQEQEQRQQPQISQQHPRLESILLQDCEREQQTDEGKLCPAHREVLYSVYYKTFAAGAFCTLLLNGTTGFMLFKSKGYHCCYLLYFLFVLILNVKQMQDCFLEFRNILRRTV